MLQALDVILGGHNSKRLQLSGHCVKSLFAILVHGENRVSCILTASHQKQNGISSWSPRHHVNFVLCLLSWNR